jgi:hypothetical protein
MEIERTEDALCLFIPEKHWARVVVGISHRVPVGVGPLRGGDRVLCLPPETTDGEVIKILTEAGFYKA